MTTLHEPDSVSKRNVHYRRLADESVIRPFTRRNISLDVTARACVPCAVVGHHRAADVVDEVGTPQCYPHAEFAALDGAKQTRIIAAWSSDGAAVGIITMIAALREGNPGWFDRCRPTVAEVGA